MKFSSIFISTLLSSVSTFATPLGPRVPTVVFSIDQALMTLETAVNADLKAINISVSDTRKGVTGITTSLTTNIPKIITALHTAGSSISQATRTSAGSLGGQAARLTQAETDQLTSDVTLAASTITNIDITVHAATSNLSGDARAAAKAEVQALNDAVGPFAQPLAIYARQVAQAGARVDLDVKGLFDGMGKLNGAVGNLLASIGLRL